MSVIHDKPYNFLLPPLLPNCKLTFIFSYFFTLVPSSSHFWEYMGDEDKLVLRGIGVSLLVHSKFLTPFLNL